MKEWREEPKIMPVSSGKANGDIVNGKGVQGVEDLGEKVISSVLDTMCLRR